MPINLDRITAVDMHVHVERDEHGNYSLDEELLAASARYFQAGADRAPGLAEIAAYYRERRLAAVVFHTGQTGIGAGLPGGRGIRLHYSNPMLIDEVAAGHPGLTIVLAHPSVPWQDEAISIATHKANVFIDLSGWAPRYFPAPLVRAANGPLRHKVLFGSDYPLISPDRWLADFADLEIKPDVRPLILKHNAARVLGLADRES